MTLAMTPTMKRGALALIACLALAGAARADDLRITEVRPTSLAAGGTLIIACPDVDPQRPASVSLTGRPAGTAGAVTFDGPATVAPGEVWLKLNLPPGQFENVTLEV